MLCAILNIHWSRHPSKERLFDNLAQITSVIKERRTRFAGHCYRSKDEFVRHPNTVKQKSDNQVRPTLNN